MQVGSLPFAAALLVALSGPVLAQELQPAPLTSLNLAQATTGDVGEAEDLDDSELLSEVMAALPAGVTLETATDDQIAAAVEAVVVANQSGAAGTGAGAGAGTGGGAGGLVVSGTGGTVLPGQPVDGQGGAPSADRIAAVAAKVLSVVSVTLDSIGRSGSSATVTNQVVATLPPQVRSTVSNRVTASRNNPRPSQVAATAIVIAQAQPAAGQQQQQQVFQPILPVQQSLGQSIFQENPNQVSPN